MANIYIYNMDVPEVCDQCLSGFVKTIGCKKRSNYDDRDKKRHPDCPMHSVPEHGKLIDYDAFVKSLVYCPPELLSDGDYILEKLAMMPEVIPADWRLA